MARGTSKLSAVAVAKAKAKGMYADGGGLYLQVSEAGTKSWIFRYMLAGRARAMGLGPYPGVSLAEARTSASECRRQTHDGLDPLEVRQSARRAQALEAARAVTFADAATRYIDSNKAGWRNAKHALQWEATLSTYAFPHIGEVSVQDIDVALVLKVLEPIWTVKTETATRVRQRIETVLDWATACELRVGENPARWRGHMENLLPAPRKVKKVRHHPALPYQELPGFLRMLRKHQGTAAMALAFTILTGTRTSETLKASWVEVDLEKRVWVIPANRIKSEREHRIPLSRPAIALLKLLRKIRVSDHIFANPSTGKPLSNMAMLKLRDRMKRSDITVHGFRSTLRDWAAETTNYPREVAEMALAHVISDKTEAAYRRGDLFEKRRALMEEWGAYCRGKA